MALTAGAREAILKAGGKIVEQPILPTNSKEKKAKTADKDDKKSQDAQKPKGTEGAQDAASGCRY